MDETNLRNPRNFVCFGGVKRQIPIGDKWGKSPLQSDRHRLSLRTLSQGRHEGQPRNTIIEVIASAEDIAWCASNRTLSRRLQYFITIFGVTLSSSSTLLSIHPDNEEALAPSTILLISPYFLFVVAVHELTLRTPSFHF